jgi:predicted peptidase
MPRIRILPKLAKVLLTGILFIAFTGCKKDAEIDPRKEANNSRVEVVPPEIRAVTQPINSSVGGYYLSVPSLYDSTSKSFPLIVSLHGGLQTGNGTSNLPSILYDGLPKLLEGGNFPASFTVNGKNYSFIVLAPQFSRYPAASEILSIIHYAKKHYRIDPKRVYLTGLSMGGGVSWEAAAAYPSEIAAIVPIAGVPKDDDNSKAQSIVSNKMPVWTFHNENDDVVSSVFTKNYVEKINSFSPALPPKLTIFKAGGHDAWSHASDPEYREGGMNIYEWMLQYSK